MEIEVNGARLFFDVVGAQLAVEGPRMVEKPTLLVLHGGPGFDHAAMRPYFDRFADTHQVIYLDHRGNGRSGGEPDAWNLAQWGDDIAGFCAALGIERPVVYGLSFGGMVAMSYAARHPQAPSKLVFSSTAGRMDLAATYAAMGRLGGPEAARVAEAFWSGPTPALADQYIQVCLPLYNPGPPDPDALARSILRTEVMFHFIEGEQRAMDLLPGLAAVRCPTLVLAGASTRSRRWSARRRSMRRFPRASASWWCSRKPATASTAPSPTAPKRCCGGSWREAGHRSEVR